MTAYPQRPPFFAHRYCRLLTKTCAAQDIGHIAFVLCVTVAHQEDAKRYTSPVTFFNEQLMPLIGVSKWDSLDRARKRAAEVGWLHYESGNRGRRLPGRYWVTVPAGLDDLGDAPCDETQCPPNGERGGEWVENQYPAKGDRDDTQSPVQPPTNGDREGERRGERDGERQGDREGELSSLSLSPNPEPKKTRPGAASVSIPQQLDTPGFKAAWAEWVEYRKSLRKKMPAATEKKQLAALAKVGPLAAIAAIEKSIAQGWIGLFPGGDDHGGKHHDGMSEKERRGGEATRQWIEESEAVAS